MRTVYTLAGGEGKLCLDVARVHSAISSVLGRDGQQALRAGTSAHLTGSKPADVYCPMHCCTSAHAH
jgi:hypothetical protein